MISILLFALISFAEVHSHPIEGKWEFTSYLYNGTELAKPNPHLTITFEFEPNGMSRLFWSRDNEPGFCDRMAQYQTHDNTIQEVIVWVNPDNNFDCGKDPDMQIGRQSKTEFRFNGSRLETRVLVGDMDVWYLWKKLN